MTRSIALVAILLILQVVVSAQTKVGIFVPGYSLDPTISWLNSGTPQRLYNEGVINRYVVLPGAVFNSVNSMTTPYSDAAASVPGGEVQRWMVIGHSLGGLLARVAEHPTLLSLYPLTNVQLKGIVTLGAPHQGLPLARNYPDAPAIMDAFAADVLAGPAWERDNDGFIDQALTWLYHGVPFYERLASSLSEARQNVTQAVRTVSQLPFVDQLQPGSNLMNALQTIPATVPHVSIAGVEYSPAIIRWAFSTDVIAGGSTMPETNAASTFQRAKDAYKAAGDYHRLWRDFWYAVSWIIPQCWWSYCYEERESDKQQAAMDAWGRGWWALDGIDNKWFYLHNEYLVGSGYGNLLDAMWRWTRSQSRAGDNFIMTTDDPCARGEAGYWVTEPYTYYYADRSDALVPQNRSAWFAGEGFVGPTTPVSALRQGNISFDAGYNNSEMRYLERPENGEASQPMQYGRSWIEYWIGFQ